MSRKFPPIKNFLNRFALLAIFSTLLTGGCAVEAARKDEKTIEKSSAPAAKNSAEAVKAASSTKNKITIEPDSPADTVRVFYTNLREGKFREALFLTNLRPAIEGLTDQELKDLQVDFAHLARQIPHDLGINGEIIAGDEATVTAKLPDAETDKIALQQIKLRREAGVWTILTVDEAAEKIIKKEGKKYFFNLKIETHEREAKKMFDRIAKAQMVFVAQNKGLYGELPVLIEHKLLPEDALTAESTGYNYKIILSADRKGYTATAEPAVYGKTGKRSFAFTVTGDKTSALKTIDTQGKPFSGQ